MNSPNFKIDNFDQIKSEVLNKLKEKNIKKNSLEDIVEEIINVFYQINQNCIKELNKCKEINVYFDDIQKKYKTK